jgi:phosphoribosylanthranilate isomerase
MKVKVCGLNNQSDIELLNKIGIDFMGFIFYQKSPRYQNKSLILSNISKYKVGVFVNEDFGSIRDKILKQNLTHVQLHGDESPSLCKKLMTLVRVIKAFRISQYFDINKTHEYLESCDYFLFDTDSDSFGGSGKKFNWDIIKNFTKKKFFLSGGIDLESIDKIQKIKKENEYLFAVDINSKFEFSPGNKDIKKIKRFLKKLNDGKF